MKPANRILHVDGDSFFASCEIALNPQLQERPIWVGGGRRGDGIVIAANRLAKKFGITTGMACFEAKRLCPKGVLCPPHYDEYRRLSLAMFKILEDYAPVIVPMSIDEGFLDSDHDDRARLAEYLRRWITCRALATGSAKRSACRCRAGLASSSRLAKLATDAAKPGFMEVPAGQEKEFLKDRPVRELSGIGKNRERSTQSARWRSRSVMSPSCRPCCSGRSLASGQQLWLFANGQWNEPLILEVKDRTTISSSTTLPHDEPDYEAALMFTLSEAIRLVGQLRREQMQTREISLAVRFNDFTEVGTSHRFKHPQFLNSVINTTLEAMFREVMQDAFRPVRQIRIAMFNLDRLDTQPTLWGTTDAERWGALDSAADQLREQLGKNVLMTGAQLALRNRDAAHITPKAKCPFTPQREMVRNLWGENPP